MAFKLFLFLLAVDIVFGNHVDNEGNVKDSEEVNNEGGKRFAQAGVAGSSQFGGNLGSSNEFGSSGPFGRGSNGFGQGGFGQQGGSNPFGGGSNPFGGSGGFGGSNGFGQGGSNGFGQGFGQGGSNGFGGGSFGGNGFGQGGFGSRGNQQGAQCQGPNQFGGMHGIQFSDADKDKFVQAFLILTFPDNCVSSYQAIPLDGRECLIEAANNPAYQQAAQQDNETAILSLIQQQCSNNSQAIESFFQTVNATTQSFSKNLQHFFTSHEATFKQLQNTSQGPPNGQQKEQIQQAVSSFVSDYQNLPQADRQSLATAYPKLSVFVVGNYSDTILTSLKAVLQLNNISDQTQAQQAVEALKESLKAAAQAYIAQNQASLQQVSALFGQDVDFGQLLSHHASSAFSFSGPAAEGSASSSIGSGSFAGHAQVTFHRFRRAIRL